MADNRQWMNLGDYCRIGSLLLDGTLITAGPLSLSSLSVGALTVTGATNLQGVTAAGVVAAQSDVTVAGNLTAAGVVTLGGFAKVGPGNFVVAATALTNVTGLTFATVANAVYAFEAWLSINSSTVAGMAVGVNHSGAGATVEAQATGSGNPASIRINALNTAVGQFDTSALDLGILITGLLTVGANAGNLTIQVSKLGTGNATVYAGSLLKVQRVA
jgi:hypothetical protein